MCGSTTARVQAISPDIRKYAAELVALAPDVIVASRRNACCVVLESRPIPADCFQRSSSTRWALVSSISLSRPGGNATGFMTFDYGFGREMA